MESTVGMSRGVIYIIWGEKAERAADRSIQSLKNIHPDLPFEIFRLPPDTDPFKGLLEKTRMVDLTPFDETLFLDADTVVLDRLDFGFEQAKRFGLACCICECPWARRYRGMSRDDTIEYNTGVLFFTRVAEPLFRRWEQLSHGFESAIDFVLPDGRRAVMPYNDQGSFAKTVAEWERPPFILPLNWNFRPAWNWSWFGPLKIWHDYSDPPPQLNKLNTYYRQPDAVIQFHFVNRG
jgi:hypothetical protein